MSIDREKEFALPSIDDIFSTQEQRDDAKLKRIYEIPIDEIDPFPEHPFKVKDDEDMMNLVESIQENGILTPVTIRKKADGRYEMISGHRRLRACQLAGIEKIRADVVEMEKDAATVYMVDSNMQRTTILPSEKAFSYKMRLEAMKRMPGRPGKNVSPLGTDLIGKRSDEILAKEIGESRNQINRYIRLTNLIPKILDMVDEGKISLRPAVELSYLPDKLQYDLLEEMEVEQCTPSHTQALKMKKMHGEGKLSADVISSIMAEEKPNQKEKLSISTERVKEFLPKDLEPVKREAYIIEALAFYKEHREREKKKNRDLER